MDGMAEGSTAQSAPETPQNILSALHTLLLSSSSKSSAYAHPFAPATNYGSWKGKAREGSMGVGLEEQRKLLDQLAASMQSATTAVNEATREEGKVKLGRAMKDVITHQSALLPLLPTFSPDLSPPSFRQPIAPIQLLEAIAQRLGIETYLEESQFGLLKTTLAIAGKRFVLDVDLEVDSATGVEEDEAGPSINADPRRGKVRLAKLLVNHVTKDGGTASSDSIGQAIQGVLEEYLVYWNGEREQEEGERIIKRLWEELGDLAGLDGMAESGRDWFAEIETMSARVKGLEVDERSSVLPSFGITGATFRLRPTAEGENVVDPFAPEKGRCDWVMEFVPVKLDGLVVRGNWLGGGVADIDGSVKVEHLLYHQEFPYSGTSTHGSAEGLGQQWSMVHSGPAGYVVGHCGVRDDSDLPRLLQALRHQVNLNKMVTSVLEGRLEQEEVDEEVDLDMLTKSPTTLPITMTLDQNALYASMPLPHSTGAIAPTLKLSFRPSLAPLQTGLDIAWTLDPASEMMDERIQGAVDRTGKVGMDVVRAVAEIERALRDT